MQDGGESIQAGRQGLPNGDLTDRRKNQGCARRLRFQNYPPPSEPISMPPRLPPTLVAIRCKPASLREGWSKGQPTIRSYIAINNNIGMYCR